MSRGSGKGFAFRWIRFPLESRSKAAYGIYIIIQYPSIFEEHMASFVKAADVAAAAVEIERRGRDMYRTAEKRAANSRDAEFFAFMAEEEKRHEGIFSGMLGRLGGLTLPAGSSEPEYLEYVGILLDSHCLFLPGAEGRVTADALHAAISMEKDTILFFTAMKRLVPEAERRAVEACIDEEKKHLRMLHERQKAR
jgi:rubrerythrin